MCRDRQTPVQQGEYSRGPEVLLAQLLLAMGLGSGTGVLQSFICQMGRAVGLIIARPGALGSLQVPGEGQLGHCGTSLLSGGPVPPPPLEG